MSFELKILDIVSCPRCNGKAQLRLDQEKRNPKHVLVYIVCDVCKLRRYSHTTTPKAVKIHQKIKRLNEKRSRVARNTSLDNALASQIRILEGLKTKAERSF